MNVSVNNWSLFPSPPSSTDSDEPGYRLREMMEQATDTHKDHFARPVEAYPTRFALDLEAAPPAAAPVVVAEQAPVRSWPRTVAVSVVLLTTAAMGTLVSSLINTLLAKKINDKMG